MLCLELYYAAPRWTKRSEFDSYEITKFLMTCLPLINPLIKYLMELMVLAEAFQISMPPMPTSNQCIYSRA